MNRSRFLKLAVFSALLIIYFVFLGCGCCRTTAEVYPVEKIIVYGVEYKNTGEVIWQDGLMAFDFTWVLEKLNVVLEWDNNIAHFSLNETEYIFDQDRLILREKVKEEENYLVYGSGRQFIGIVNEKMYVDSTSLIGALFELKLYSYVETDSKSNSVSIVANQNYP